MADTVKTPSIFENEDWLVTPAGIEHKGTRYAIDRERLGDRRGDGLWAWPLHMAEKSWCRMPGFAEAFARAASAFAIPADEALARSFALAGAPEPGAADLLQLGDAARISLAGLAPPPAPRPDEPAGEAFHKARAARDAGQRGLPRTPTARRAPEDRPAPLLRTGGTRR